VRPHLLIPFVLYASVRLPFRWVCVLVMVLALLLVALTVDGRPPFGLAAPSIAAITVQEFVMVVSVLSLGVSSLLAHLRVREEELHRANEELRRRTVALERNNRELQRIAYVASHDLQTPLRSISGFSQLLRRRYGGRLGPTADDWIRRVTDNTQRLERLLRALGDVAAVDTAGAPFAPVDLNAVFAAATADLDAEIRAAAAVVTRDELPVVVGDRVQLLRVMRELICNALTARGRAPTSIHVSAREDLREWIVSVRDDGVGIPAGEQERVFNLFYRTAGPGPAVGAGLALCARVVHRHGGRIWVESTPGAGSTFSFSIPKDAADVVA
jgi:light-regulated signal transduction histidine kinase (bacteriophytochrome)